MQQFTSESLAREFLSRANEFGWLRLTKKQGAWLYSLAMREHRDEPGGFGRSRYGAFRVIEGDGWKLVEERNGSWTLGEGGF